MKRIEAGVIVAIACYFTIVVAPYRASGKGHGHHHHHHGASVYVRVPHVVPTPYYYYGYPSYYYGYPSYNFSTPNTGAIFSQSRSSQATEMSRRDERVVFPESELRETAGTDRGEVVIHPAQSGESREIFQTPLQVADIRQTPMCTPTTPQNQPCVAQPSSPQAPMATPQAALPQSPRVTRADPSKAPTHEIYQTEPVGCPKNIPAGGINRMCNAHSGTYEIQDDEGRKTGIKYSHQQRCWFCEHVPGVGIVQWEDRNKK